jgi:hypothetical protein
MNDRKDISGIDEESGADCATLPVCLPPNFVELIELRSTQIELRLGYFRKERFVVFGYCPGGGDVLWKDGHSSGFGAGGWRTFLEEIAPLAQRRGMDLGGTTAVGTHVLLIDRHRKAAYVAPRESAEDFLARVCGVPRSVRRCLCTVVDCASCPIRTCPKAGRGTQPIDSVRGTRIV